MSALRLRQEGVACSDLGSEIVILDLDTSQYFSARHAGAVLVDALVAGTTVPDMVERLVARYHVDHAEATADVTKFVDQLRSRNLLEPGRP